MSLKLKHDLQVNLKSLLAKRVISERNNRKRKIEQNISHTRIYASDFKNRIIQFAATSLAGISLLQLNLNQNNMIETQQVQAKAAVFSNSELKAVKEYQTKYQQISKIKHDRNSMLQNPKNPAYSELNSDYKNSYLDTVNYYRSMFDLSPLTYNQKDMKKAQLAAYALATSHASPQINQHGMSSDRKPAKMSWQKWKIAKEVTNISNLDFLPDPNSGFTSAQDFLSEKHDSSDDTGHRAWLLSAKLHYTGLGSVYDSVYHNKDVVMPVIHHFDTKHESNVSSVLYPAKLFPIEEAKGTRWSVYLDKPIKDKKYKVYITDLDTGRKTKGRSVQNFSDSGYGWWQGIITYKYGKTKLIPGHKYRIRIPGVKTYTTKLFNERTKHVYPME